MKTGAVALVASVVLLQLAYLVGAAAAPNPYFGINQLRHLPLLAVAAILMASWVVRWPARASTNSPPPSRRASAVGGAFRWRGFPLDALVAAVAAGALFLAFPSHAPNPDGVALLEKIARDVPARGAHLTHDEMLELFVHSRVYAWAREAWGWSVASTYRVLSALAGAVFVCTLLQLSRGAAPGRRLAYLALVSGCGSWQLFFGDIENYSLVAAVILLYLAAARAHLEDRVPLWVPSLLLSIAIGFHLLAGWLLPSLGYLFSRSLARGQTRSLATGAAALVLPLVALLVYFDGHGLPIARLFDSSHVSGMGGHYDRYLAPASPRYFGGIINVLLLLAPPLIVLPALAACRRLGEEPFSRFLQVAAASTLAFAFVWRAQLGVYEDWNLFAPGMIPVTLLLAQVLAGPDRVGLERRAARALALSGLAHSAAWIAANHLAVR